MLDNNLRIVAGWAAVVVAGGGGVLLMIFLIWRICQDNEFVQRLTNDWVRPVVGIPLAALLAFCIVAILQATVGTIKFKALGVEFEGASGPVVLWIFSFLAVVWSIYLLWPKGENDSGRSN